MLSKNFIAIIIAVVAGAVVLFSGNQTVINSNTELGTAIVSKKGSGSQDQVRALERELTVLNKDKNIVGPDHIQRLWQRLVDLWNKKALTRAKAEQLYQLLLAIYYRSNPQPTAQKAQPTAQKSATASLGELTKEVKAEIDHIGARENVYLTKEHYHELKKRLDYLTSQGVPDLGPYYQVIEARSPQAIAAVDQAKQVAEEKEHKKLKEKEAQQGTQPVTRPSGFTPPPASMILPFKISEISYAGTAPVHPFGSGGAASADIVFEVKPGTILRAAAAGRITLRRNPIGRTSDGQPFDPQDWELQILLDGGYYLEYDHVVEPLVSDGQSVQQGQSLARADPAAIRHGGPQGQLPVDEFEWGLGYAAPPDGRPIRVCPADYLTAEERAKLMSIANPCLVQETAG